MLLFSGVLATTLDHAITAVADLSESGANDDEINATQSELTVVIVVVVVLFIIIIIVVYIIIYSPRSP